MRAHDRDDYDQCSWYEHLIFWAVVAVILTILAVYLGLYLGHS